MVPRIRPDKNTVKTETLWCNGRILLTAEQRLRPTQRKRWPSATWSTTKVAEVTRDRTQYLLI